MQTSTNSKMYSEVYAILELLGSEYKNKIPSKLITLIEEKKSTSYNPTYNIEDLLDETKVSESTINMIALFHLNFWATTEEKLELKNLFHNNEEKYQNELKEKYSVDNLFKTNEKTLNNTDINSIESVQTEDTNNNLPVEINENILKKIIHKIISIFQKFSSR